MIIAKHYINRDDVSNIGPVHANEYADFTVWAFTVHMKNGHQFTENSQNKEEVEDKYFKAIKDMETPKQNIIGFIKGLIKI